MNIGYIIDSYHIPKWLYEAIRLANQLEHSIHTVLVIKLSPHNEPIKKTNLFSSVINGINHFVFKHLMTWDKNRAIKCNLTEENDAFALKDIHTLFMKNTFKEINPNSLHLSFSDLESIKAMRLNVLINLSQCEVQRELLTIPTHGVWQFSLLRDYQQHHPVGFWEIYHHENTIPSSLLKLVPESKTHELLAEAVIPVNDYGSMTMTANSLAWDSSPLIYFCLRKLLLTQDPHLIIRNYLSKKTTHTKKPNALDCVLLLFKLIYKKLKSRGFISQHWHIHFSNKQYNLANHHLSYKNFIRIEQPKNKFWADPFIIYHEKKHYLLFEEYDYSLKKGIIRISEINDQGLAHAPITILQEEFHFSNPYVFVEDGNLYLLPEQAQSGEIALYQCIHFPDHWQKVATLLKGGYYADPILLKKDNKWWLFVVEKMSNHGFPSVYGKLWFADNLFGEWQEHPMSPIATDCRISRSAGAFFEENNQLIRPVQDCSNEYGYKINFLHIMQLTESTYQDTLFTHLEPKAFQVDGIHTYNFTDGMTVIDTRKKTSKKMVYNY